MHAALPTFDCGALFDALDAQRQERGHATSCQYALFMLRRLDRAPEDFLTGADVGDTSLPEARPDCRLQWLRRPAAAFIHRRNGDRRTLA